ncbi:MAG: uroporphyrinogen-III synthase [Burkholderiaceae bacterium]|nr:uroporphyrinogen-III synthase [Burkholderiaceae bacterium]
MASEVDARDTLVLVTRPAQAGERLTCELRARGQRALWWPAFDLLAPEQKEPLLATLRHLADFDLAIFVSVQAVRSLAALAAPAAVPSQWPSQTAIAAVGPGTLALAHSLLPGARCVRSIGTHAGGGTGSEALWEVLRSAPALPRSVLIVRAETGREWLGERLREAGCQVETIGVYRRIVHVPSSEQRAALAACRSGGERAASLVTSSEAVAALDRQFAQAPDEKAWLRSGLALCSHPRIAQALRAAGYGDVRECEASASAVIEAIAPRRDAETLSRPAEAL